MFQNKSGKLFCWLTTRRDHGSRFWLLQGKDRSIQADRIVRPSFNPDLQWGMKPC